MIEKVDILKNLCYTVAIAVFALNAVSHIAPNIGAVEASCLSPTQIVVFHTNPESSSESSNQTILSTNGIFKHKLLALASKLIFSDQDVRPLPVKVSTQDDNPDLNLALTLSAVAELSSAIHNKIEFNKSENSDSSYSYFLII